MLLVSTTSPTAQVLAGSYAGNKAGPLRGRPPRLVLLLLDEFPLRTLLDPSGRVDGRLFPGFARLAAESTWFSDATTVSGATVFAVPALLTGRFPRTRGPVTPDRHPDNLFSLLGPSHVTTASEVISELCLPRYCGPPPSPRPKGTPREPEPVRFADFLDLVSTPSNEPRFDFLHSLLPHIPHQYVPSGRRYPEERVGFPLSRQKEGDPFRRNTQQLALTVVQQRLLLQTVYTDQLVGQLIDRMKAAGTWDESLVVVVADHGAGFVPGEGARVLDANNAADLAYVPLFVKRPWQRTGAVDARNAMIVDVLPTVADALGVTVPFSVDGSSLLGAPRRTRQKTWFDVPGRRESFDGEVWSPIARRGYAGEVARPDLGADGLFAVGAARQLYGRSVAELTVGPPSAVVATPIKTGAFDRVDLSSGVVPALTWGDLDRGPSGGASWLVAAVNGTVAGSVAAAPARDGSWHFIGMLADRFFVTGRNDVRLYVVEGSTLRPVAWR